MLSSLESGTLTIPTCGSPEVAGYIVVSICWPVSALNTVVLPVFDKPIIATFTLSLLYGTMAIAFYK
jgi:hypothetical protein